MSGASPCQPLLLGRLGPWRVLRRLGRGGAAVVYEVLQPETGQRAALKLLNDPAAHTRVVQREYRTLALLDHPGIVRAYGCGRLPAGAPWLLTELVVGTTSQASVKLAGPCGSPARAARATRIAHGLLAALAYLHQRRIIHRDVKSSNVLATVEGGVKLLDLGAAGHAPASAGPGPVRVPAGGLFAGTVVYASPEHLARAALDARTDLFSVGVLWYRMLTGELPFPASDPGAALAQRAAGPPLERLWQVTGPVSPVPELIASLLAAEPARRPAGVAAVLERVDPLLSEAPLPRTAFWPEPPPLCGRGPVLEALDRFVAEAPAGAMAVLEAGPGQEEGALLDWAVGTVRRAGGVAVGVDLADAQRGGLLSRLLFALPRHLRRVVGTAPSPREAAMGALGRMACGRAAFVLLALDGLECAGDADLADLEALLAMGAARGAALRAVGLWRAGAAGAPRSWPSGTLRLVLPPMSPAAVLRHARTLSAQRVLPCSIEAALLREGPVPRGGVGRWARALVASGGLVLATSPEGVWVWVEGSAEVEEGAVVGEPGLGERLAGDPGRVPWGGDGACQPDPFSGLAGVEPDEIPDPRVRVALFAWRGLARQSVGDRDLQVEADLLRAGEELARVSEWEHALVWCGRLALAQVSLLALRGRIQEARRLLAGPGPTDGGPGWPLRVESLRLDLARLAGEPSEACAEPAAAPAAALAWLQAGRLRAVARCVAEAGTLPSGGWGAADRAALAAAAAGALRCRGALAHARTLLSAAIEADQVTAPGPARARLLLALAEVDLDLFQPGPARERLADAWVLLRQTDRPELKAERARLLARAALVCGEPERAEEAARGGIEALRRTDLALARAGLGCWLARALGRQGRRAEAEAVLGPACLRIEATGAHPALSLACLVRWELSGIREDPWSARAPVEAWMASERARLPRFEWLIAELRHTDALGDRSARIALRRRARVLLRSLQRGLSPEDCGVMEQSPALRVVLGVG